MSRDIGETEVKGRAVWMSMLGKDIMGLPAHLPLKNVHPIYEAWR